MNEYTKFTKAWGFGTDPDCMTEKQLFAVLETLLDVVEWSSCNQSIF